MRGPTGLRAGKDRAQCSYVDVDIAPVSDRLTWIAGPAHPDAAPIAPPQAVQAVNRRAENAKTRNVPVPSTIPSTRSSTSASLSGSTGAGCSSI